MIGKRTKAIIQRYVNTTDSIGGIGKTWFTVGIISCYVITQKYYVSNNESMFLGRETQSDEIQIKANYTDNIKLTDRIILDNIVYSVIGTININNEGKFIKVILREVSDGQINHK